ncbi:MAG: SDR family oxidoreductase [Gemmatimonadaceae bacterium]|jgi:NAD(P)-dependent dehydrogenase (short-subunit alcohol dehydrogenase family)|nr:SDR family oxidoreductase [Gemmatimonadaceae bacterium]
MSDLDFTGKLVVITGVGRAGQVGEAIALGFAQRGATLALLDLQQADVDARAATLTALGYTVSAHAANLSDATAADGAAAAVIDATRDRFGGAVHAVVCAAGGFGVTGALDSSEVALWQRQFLINLDTAYNATRAFLPAVRQGSGAYTYFGSAAVLPGGKSKGLAAYTAAKSGVLALMRAVAEDERAHGVRANAIAPTQVRTAANIEAMGADKDYVERESVADVVAFLSSTLARNISGQVITLA